METSCDFAKFTSPIIVILKLITERSPQQILSSDHRSISVPNKNFPTNITLREIYTMTQAELGTFGIFEFFH